MKSIKDLQAIRERALASVNVRKEEDGIRVVVGMATRHAAVRRGSQSPQPAECDRQPDWLHRHVPLRAHG